MPDEVVDIEMVDDAPFVRMASEDDYAFKVTDEFFEIIEQKKRPSKKFWKGTRVGRFLSGRTKAGRVVRRVGVGALAVGASLVGIDAEVIGIGTDMMQGTKAEGASQLTVALKLIKEIALIVGGIVTAITKAVDGTENYQEKADELEAKEGKKMILRKIKSKKSS